MKLHEYERIVQVLETTILRALHTYDELTRNNDQASAAASTMEEAEEYFCAHIDSLVEV